MDERKSWFHHIRTLSPPGWYWCWATDLVLKCMAERISIKRECRRSIYCWISSLNQSDLPRLEIRNEELNHSKRNSTSVKSKSVSSRGRASVLSGINEDGAENILMDIERHDSLISGLSSAMSRPGTAQPPNKEDHLEKALYDAIFWRKESIANKDILSLVFVMMINTKNQEIVGIRYSQFYYCYCLYLYFLPKDFWIFSQDYRRLFQCWKLALIGLSLQNMTSHSQMSRRKSASSIILRSSIMSSLTTQTTWTNKK